MEVLTDCLGREVRLYYSLLEETRVGVKWLCVAVKHLSDDAVMERVDEQGLLLGFSVMNVSRISKDKPLVAKLIAKAV